MQVRVLFFGALREAITPATTIELPDGATAADLLTMLAARSPAVAAMCSSLAVAVNQEYARGDTVLRDSDEVAVLPPVSGGAEDSVAGSAASISIRLQREPIQTQMLRSEITAPSDGAVLVFEGVVRNKSRGRRTLYLDYEAYEPMARNEMEKLAAEALRRFAVRSVVIAHRIGRLEIGEVSVCIVVASAHRGPAYEASRFLIDTLKRTVPIWKREHFEDGAVWVDGEPFPAEIRAPENSPAGNPT